MANQQLLDYVKQQLQKGDKKEDIKNSLVANGWEASDIEEVFNSLNESSQYGSIPESSNQPVKYDNPEPLNQPASQPVNQHGQYSNAPEPSNKIKQYGNGAESPKNKILFTIIIIISVLVIDGGAAGYFFLIRNSSALPVSQTSPQGLEMVKYTDPQNRFSFSYPSVFGSTSQGSNSGIGNRLSAVRFSEFSWGVRDGKFVLGGEAVLTKGFVLVDIHALGGLYDPIASLSPQNLMQAAILSNLPPITIANFCEELAKELHIDISKPAFISLSQQQKDAIVKMDQTRGAGFKVIRCDVVGDTVIFQEETGGKLDQANRNIYGAVRFLKLPFSSFQVVRSTIEAPTQDILDDMTSVVKSFNEIGNVP